MLNPNAMLNSKPNTIENTLAALPLFLYSYLIYLLLLAFSNATLLETLFNIKGNINKNRLLKVIHIRTIDRLFKSRNNNIRTEIN